MTRINQMHQTNPNPQRALKSLRRLAACTALIAAAWVPGYAATIAARSTGEIDVVAQGPNYSLMYYVSLSDPTNWVPFAIAGGETTFSEPQIAVRPDGEADIVALSVSNSILYYWALPGANWQVTTVTPGDPNAAIVGQPAIAVNAKRADIVQVQDGRVLHYWATPGSKWHSQTVAKGASPYNPAIAVRKSGEVDIAFVSKNGSLMYYWLVPGSRWQFTELRSKGFLGAPSISVNSAGLAAVAAYDSYCLETTSVDVFTAAPGSAWTDASCNPAPSFPNIGAAVRSTGEVDVVAQGAFGPHLFDYLIFWPTGFGGDFALGPQTDKNSSTPSIAVGSNNTANVAMIAPDNSLWYYWAQPSAPWSSFMIAGPGTSF